MMEKALENVRLSSSPLDPTNNELVAYGRDRLAKRLDEFLLQLSGKRGMEEAFIWRTICGSADARLRRALVGEPLFRYWWTRLVDLLRRQHTEAVTSWSRHFPRFLGPMIISGPPRPERITLPADAEGIVRLPGFRVAIVVAPSAQGWHHLTRLDNGITLGPVNSASASIFIPDAALAGAADHENVIRLPVVPDTDILVDASDPWIVGRLADLNAQAPEPPHPRRDLAPYVVKGSRLMDTYRRAFDLIGIAWPQLAQEIKTDVRLIAPFESKLLLGWSDITFLHAIFIRAAEEDLPFSVERLAHEAAHVRLFAVTHMRLHNHPPDFLLSSPVRADSRPVTGLIHAAFVSARLIELFRRVGRPEYVARATEILPKFNQTIDVLRRSASLTPTGKGLIDDLAARVAEAATQ
jgi:HEXXH motif-containing protein